MKRYVEANDRRNAPIEIDTVSPTETPDTTPAYPTPVPPGGGEK
jgi:hypothetical protein